MYFFIYLVNVVEEEPQDEELEKEKNNLSENINECYKEIENTIKEV